MNIARLLLITIAISFMLLTSPTLALDLPFFYQSARVVAMGDAFTAVADDESAITYNPAGLATIEKNSISVFGKVFNYNFDATDGTEENYFNGYVGGSVVFEKFGVQLLYTEFGDKITINSESDFMEEGFKITAAFGYEIGKFLVGANANVLAYSNAAEGVSFDVGGMYRISEYLTAGITLKNIINGGTFFVIGDRSNTLVTFVPVFVNLGIGIKPFKELTASIEVKNLFESHDNGIYQGASFPMRDFKRSYHVGGEYVIAQLIAIRAGVSAGEDTSTVIPNLLESNWYEYEMKMMASFGLGFFIEFAKIDIAVVNDFRSTTDTIGAMQYYLSSTWTF